MKESYTVVLAIVIAMILIIATLGAVYIGLYFENDTNTDDNSDDNNNDDSEPNPPEDTIPPTITAITKDTTAYAGEQQRIICQFDDNIGVTEAILYYQNENSTTWIEESILAEYYILNIPENQTEDIFYYITVNDQADNGPIGDPSIDGTQFYTITVQPIPTEPPETNATNYVFIEEATATDCRYCPKIGEIIEELYSTEQYEFYYVSLVKDQSSIANTRLENDYNWKANPTVYVDGGYRVLFGSSYESSDYIQALLESSQRQKANLSMKLSALYLNETQMAATQTTITNHQETTYTGELRLYLTEIISNWDDYDGNAYHYTLVDYITIEDISISAGENLTLNHTKIISSYDYQNIQIIAVLFNSEENTGYSDPNELSNEFTAHYTDFCTAARLTEDDEEVNLPPQIGFNQPIEEQWYRNGEICLDFYTNILKYLNRTVKTRFFGENTIIINAEDDIGLLNISLFIDDDFVTNLSLDNTTYTISAKNVFATLFGALQEEHTIRVVATDTGGKTSEDTLTIYYKI